MIDENRKTLHDKIRRDMGFHRRRDFLLLKKKTTTCWLFPELFQEPVVATFVLQVLIRRMVSLGLSGRDRLFDSGLGQPDPAE